MKKALYIGGALIVIATIVFVLFYGEKKTAEQPATSTKTTSPVPLPPSIPRDIQTSSLTAKLESTSEDRLIYNAPSGDITINNFVKNAEITENGIIYPVDKKNYNIGYNSTSKKFIMTLLVITNIESTRKEAESDLLTSLGISREDACKIKVFLYVSAALTTDKALSQNHGLSFCPGSVPFPN